MHVAVKKKRGFEGLTENRASPRKHFYSQFFTPICGRWANTSGKGDETYSCRSDGQSAIAAFSWMRGVIP